MTDDKRFMTDEELKAAMTPKEKSEMEMIARLARLVFPERAELARFFKEQNEVLGGVPGVMVNTPDGREEVKELLALMGAMKEMGTL